MKIRESGMPVRSMWQRFFNAEKILAALGVNNQVVDVVEFGCGYGTFTIPAARIIKGKIYALDIDHDMIRITSEEVKNHGLNNVEVIERDFIAEGSGFQNESIAYVMLFNILHVENPEKLLQEAWRILGWGGEIGIIHWNYDPTTPRGPSMAIRPKPEQCIKWAESVGFKFVGRYDLEPYHYGIVLEKRSQKRRLLTTLLG